MSSIFRVLFTIFSWTFTIVSIPIVLLIGVIRVLMGKSFSLPLSPDEKTITAEDLELRRRVTGDSATVDVNLDKLSKGEQHEFREVILEDSEFAMFEGRVKHGYDSRLLSTLEHCPTCKKATREMYANFVYATQKGMRVMLAPAGYFCTKCPTVIVDQDMVRGGVSRRFKYRGVLGLSDPNTDKFEPFDTWNGKKAVYIMDEDGGNVELTSTDMMPDDTIFYNPHPGLPRKKHDKIRRRNKIAKQSRKKNRRRKK